MENRKGSSVIDRILQVTISAGLLFILGTVLWMMVVSTFWPERFLEMTRGVCW